MFKRVNSGIRFLVGIALCVLVRLVPHPPNFEPVLGFTLPFAKKYGKYFGLAFAVLAMASIDFVTGRLGWWTVYTAGAYGVIGFIAGVWGKNLVGFTRTAGFTVAATLFFDATTAFLFGMQFNQPLAVTFAGQVPFTAMHLAGNLFFVLAVSPLVSRFLVQDYAPAAVRAAS